MNDIAVSIEHVTKQYRLGAIGGGTLKGDLQSFMARRRGKEDPNSKIGSDAAYHKNEKFLALDDVSFDVKKGEIVGIIGHNGAGKSTLLKLLSRVTAPTSGRICLNGRIASMLEVGTGFHPELTGRENVYMNGAILGMSKAEINKKFDEIVEFAEMSQFIDTPVKRYSSGMYVKLAFAVAAHLDSEIMVMDEVLAVGDMKFQDKCLGKMSDVSNQEGRTVLYVSHNMGTIKRLCDRCIVLDHGKKIFDGDVEQGINIYSNGNTRPRTHHVFKKAPYWDYYSRSIQMKSADLTNTTDCVYKRGEKVECELRYHSDTDVNDLRLRAEIWDSVDNLIGISYTDILPPVTKNTDGCIRFAFDTSMLSSADYYINLNLYQSNALGVSTTIDLAKRAFSFQILDESNAEHFIWSGSLGGFNWYPKIELL